MFSAKALASAIQAFSIRSFVISCLVFVPHVLWSQSNGTGSGQSSEDPPPVWYWPGISGPADITAEPSEPQAFICRSAFTNQGSPFCAGEIGLGDTTSFDIASGATMLTFHLRTHETVSLRTWGSIGVVARILDAFGDVVTSGNPGDSSTVVRTLAPGRYYVELTGRDGARGSSSLRLLRTTPLAWSTSRATNVLSEEIGNHCGRAAAIGSASHIDGTFERSADIDVFKIELEHAGDLWIDVEARYELKGADCATSLGVANAALGATLTPLDAGTYYLYVSRNDDSGPAYELRTELR